MLPEVSFDYFATAADIIFAIDFRRHATLSPKAFVIAFIAAHCCTADAFRFLHADGWLVFSAFFGDS